ncbi:MAG: outer membrane beta-barrel protein [Betaproteobacteria bacterium]|nr:outer membrane beta-barrel protein [Betaproteobacteria bacterium]MBV9361637.1 outer membrane beta-barrel protein [Betaproteobacteria bacterium]
MNKASLAVAVLILSCGAARADNTGWYAGINAGASRLGMSGTDINGALANQGINGASTNLHTTDKAAGLEIGYRMSEHFGVEGGYEYLGKFKYDSTAGATTINGKYKAQALSLAALGFIPFSSSLSFYAKGGFQYNTVDLNASSSSAAVPVSGKSESRAGWLAGLGLKYEFDNGVYTRVGWDHYAHVGVNGTTGTTAIDLFQVGLGMKF